MKNIVFKLITLSLILCSAQVGLAMDFAIGDTGSPLPDLFPEVARIIASQGHPLVPGGAQNQSVALTPAPPAKKIKKDNNEHVCKELGCGKTFPSRAGLKQHKLIHSGVRSYVCKVSGCGKRFIQVGHLRTHHHTHFGAKPFKCNLDGCTRRFARADDLRSHENTHKGIENNVCTVCQASFSRASNLKTHMRSHTKEKSYKCQYCSKGYPRSDVRNFHEINSCRARPLDI